MIEPLVYDIKDVARALKTSVKTIRKRLRDRAFPIPRIHGIDKKYRWSKAEVEKFVAKGGVQ